MHSSPVNRSGARNSLLHGAGISIFRDCFPSFFATAPTYHPLLHPTCPTSTTLVGRLSAVVYPSSRKVRDGAADALSRQEKRFDFYNFFVLKINDI